jgi:hypothetical protein
MLQDKSSNDIFSWDSSGTSFIVKDTNEFSKKILPQHFKHCNFASFVRQLNKYDFHKIRNSDDGQKLNGDQVIIFYYATPYSFSFSLYFHKSSPGSLSTRNSSGTALICLKKLDARRLERRRGIIAAAMNHLSNH